MCCEKEYFNRQNSILEKNPVYMFGLVLSSQKGFGRKRKSLTSTFFFTIQCDSEHRKLNYILR